VSEVKPVSNMDRFQHISAKARSAFRGCSCQCQAGCVGPSSQRRHHTNALPCNVMVCCGNPASGAHPKWDSRSRAKDTTDVERSNSVHSANHLAIITLRLRIHTQCGNNRGIVSAVALGTHFAADDRTIPTKAANLTAGGGRNP
jgi:hypothetical protein